MLQSEIKSWFVVVVPMPYIWNALVFTNALLHPLLYRWQRDARCLAGWLTDLQHAAHVPFATALKMSWQKRGPFGTSAFELSAWPCSSVCFQDKH